MGYVSEQIAEPNQTVEGVIIGLEDDQKLKWAISSVPSINFYRYKIDFKLEQS
jgi:restriction system protein